MKEFQAKNVKSDTGVSDDDTARSSEQFAAEITNCSQKGYCAAGRLKIGVNARLLAEPYTGIGRYTQHLFNKLAKAHPLDEFTLVTYKPVETKFPRNVRIVVIPEKWWLFSASLKKGFWESTQLTNFFKKNKFDILHYTYPCPLSEQKAIVTIHDVIPFKTPEYQRRLRSKIYFGQIKKALAKAPIQFLAVSETTKREAEKYLGIPGQKITTTYEAASDTYLREPKDLLSKFNIDKPYLLYVGGYDARKNVDYLCQIFRTIQPKFPDLKLVLAGGKLHKDKLYSSYDLPKSIEKGKINLLRTGFVSEEELSALYGQSVALINLSKQEGFNLPLLEAGYAGTPIVASDIEVHRELYEENALFLPLDDPEKASQTLTEFLKNPARQEEFRTRAKELRDKYTWEKTAEKTYEAYEKIAK